MVDISISDKGATVAVQRNGQVYSKPVDAKELIGIMDQFCTFETGLLPPNTRYFSTKANQIILMVEFPYTLRTLFVKHDGSNQRMTIENVPMPPGIFIFKVNKQQGGDFSLQNLRLFALKEGGLKSLDDPLFRYPAPNVEPSGHICWGGHQRRLFAELKTISALEGVVRAYFRTDFNDHIWYTDSVASCFPRKGITEFRKVEQYFNKLVELGTFKDEWMNITTYTPRQMLKGMGANV